MELNIGVVSKIVVAALVEQYGSPEAVVQAVADQLEVGLITQQDIDAAKRTIVELRERVYQLENSVAIASRSVELATGMIVDTPRGKARVVIVDAAA